MNELKDLIILKKERIKVKISSDERIQLVRAEQSLKAKRYSRAQKYSVQRVKSFLEKSNNNIVEINSESLELIKKKDTRHVRVLLEVLELYALPQEEI